MKLSFRGEIDDIMNKIIKRNKDKRKILTGQRVTIADKFKLIKSK